MAQQQKSFFELFVNLLRDIFDAENQIVEALPKVIQTVSHNDLKQALSQHLEETKNQVQRLKKIFKTLNENPTGEGCQAMRGLIQELNKIIQISASPAVKDAGIIIGAQKIEHYEISCYGSARALARHLNNTNVNERVDFDEIADTLQASLDEESDADDKLTEIAEGGFFTRGINEEAEKEQTRSSKNR